MNTPKQPQDNFEGKRFQDSFNYNALIGMLHNHEPLDDRQKQHLTELAATLGRDVKTDVAAFQSRA